MSKYDINLIKEMRLKGKSLKNIADYYNVSKSTISKFLKRNNIIFWKLPKKCVYCGKIFKPQKPNHKYCCRQHFLWERRDRNWRYFRRKNKYITTLDRNNVNVAYKDAVNNLVNLQDYAEKVGCECGNHTFIIDRGEVYCNKCGLVFELD